ncbi:hypothetical protein OSTOST_04601 [Ostertagia ostertagi]
MPRNHVRRLLCLSSNIRSIHKNGRALLYHIEQFGFDLIALSATWLSAGAQWSSSFGSRWPQYDLIRSDHISKKGIGVAVLDKKTLSTVTVLRECCPEGYEILCVDIIMAPSATAAATNILFHAISDLISSHHHCIITGYFNLSDIDWSTPSGSTSCSATSKSFTDLCGTHLLAQHVKVPTLGGNILDLVLTNTDGLIHGLSVAPPLGTSDHSSVVFDLNLFAASKPLIKKRSFKDANYNAIRTHLAGIDCSRSFGLSVNQ